MTTDEKTSELLEGWRTRALLALLAYNAAASRCRTFHNILGMSSVVVTAALSTTIFTALEKSSGDVERAVVAGLGALGAILISALSFAALPQRATDYEATARRFASVRRLIEVEMLLIDGSNREKRLDLIRSGLDAAASDARSAPARIWSKKRRHIKGHFTFFEKLRSKISGVPLKRLGI